LKAAGDVRISASRRVPTFLRKFNFRFHSTVAAIRLFPIQTTLGFAALLRLPDVSIRLFRNIKEAGSTMKAVCVAFFKDETGATAIEYGLIATGIAIAIITAVNGVGTKLSSTFGSVSTALTKTN
jgi:pilus assembly protein Flp/PilA